MSPTFVMTSAWWLDAPPRDCWPLVAQPQRWPLWWRSVVRLGLTGAASPAPRTGPGWRPLLGLPLRLRARPGVCEPGQWVEWQIGGDLHARLIWVLSAAAPGGCDVTCRWEMAPPCQRPDWLRSLSCLWLERSHFRRMRACARDMGTELGCKRARLREWSGLAHR